MEQILIRNLPAGTKAALCAHTERHHRSVEAEARDVLAEALERDPITTIDLLSTNAGADIEFEPAPGRKRPNSPPVKYVVDTNVVTALRVRGRHRPVEI